MAADSTVKFAKMNGLGNKIVVLDLRGSDRVLSEVEARAIAAAPRMTPINPPAISRRANGSRKRM